MRFWRLEHKKTKIEENFFSILVPSSYTGYQLKELKLRNQIIYEINYV